MTNGHRLQALIQTYAQVGAWLKLFHNENDQPKSIAPLNKEVFATMTALRTKFIFFQTLALLYEGEHFVLDTNACNLQVSCVLQQD